jgi:hypothetical protein
MTAVEQTTCRSEYWYIYSLVPPTRPPNLKNEIVQRARQNIHGFHRRYHSFQIPLLCYVTMVKRVVCQQLEKRGYCNKKGYMP